MCRPLHVPVSGRLAAMQERTRKASRVFLIISAPAFAKLCHDFGKVIPAQNLAQASEPTRISTVTQIRRDGQTLRHCNLPQAAAAKRRAEESTTARR
jgi:hypothetical protein